MAGLLAPHLALEDCDVVGYKIRKGTRVFVNTWSIGKDPSIWDAPEEFCPDRFLGKAMDVKGQNFELLPFGSGRRMCPGYSLGLKLFSSTLANMLHGFNWKLLHNMKSEELSMDEVYGLSTGRKFPLVAVINTRLGVIGMLHFFFHQKRKKKECFILIGMRQQGNRTHTHDRLI